MADNDNLIAVLCPGQGAQRPGFAQAWLEEPEFHEIFSALAEVSRLDLVTLGTTADAETIRDTAIAQPLIVAAAIAAGRLLESRFGLRLTAVETVLAGHSVGELAAASLAGVLTDQEAIELVTIRGRAMAAVAAQEGTGMSAVIGGDLNEVSRELAERGLVAANVNGAGQVVAAGPTDALAVLGQRPPAGTRVRPLPVAGAFHTPYMAPAADALAAAATRLIPAQARSLLLSNTDGRLVNRGQDVLDRLVAQVSRQVRWDLCMSTLADLGVRAVIELPPAGTLTGLIRQALPGVPTVAVKSPADLPTVAALLEHTSAQ